MVAVKHCKSRLHVVPLAVAASVIALVCFSLLSIGFLDSTSTTLLDQQQQRSSSRYHALRNRDEVVVPLAQAMQRFVRDDFISGRSRFDANLLEGKPLRVCGADSLSLPGASVLSLPGGVGDITPPLTDVAWSIATDSRASSNKIVDLLSRKTNRAITYDRHGADNGMRYAPLLPPHASPAANPVGVNAASCRYVNAYLGFAVNTDADAVQYLLLSFNRFHNTGCDVIFIFSDAVDDAFEVLPELATAMHMKRIVLLNVSEYWPTDAATRSLHATAVRYFVFANWMRRTGGFFDYVMHIDVRDVIFQQNFFANFHHIASSVPELRTGVFSLAEESVFAEDDLSSSWVRDVLDDSWASGPLIHCLVNASLDEMPLPIMNSGIVGGAADAYADYLTAMTAVIAAMNITARHRYGIDQGVHIVLFTIGLQWSQFPHPVLLLSGRVGPARNSYLPPADIFRDVFGRPVNCNRQAYALLHQLDRFPSVQKEVRAPYRALTRHASLVAVSHTHSAALQDSVRQRVSSGDDEAGNALFDVLSSVRSGAFRYVSCRAAGGVDHRVLLLIVLCGREFGGPAHIEPFLRRLAEVTATCVDIVIIVVGGSMRLVTLEIDFDGRLEVFSTPYDPERLPTAVAHEWLQQHTTPHAGDVDYYPNVAILLDVNVSAFYLDGSQLGAADVDEVATVIGGGIGLIGPTARSELRNIVHDKERVAASAQAIGCQVPSRWWRVCWSLLTSNTTTTSSSSSGLRLLLRNASLAVGARLGHTRHPRSANASLQGIFITHVANWNT